MSASFSHEQDDPGFAPAVSSACQARDAKAAILLQALQRGLTELHVLTASSEAMVDRTLRLLGETGGQPAGRAKAGSDVHWAHIPGVLSSRSGQTDPG